MINIYFDNPFIISKNEQITNDSDYIELFSPSVLDLIPREDLFHRIVYIYSSPGGGKSSLLRVFSPSVLATIAKKKNLNLDLYDKLLNYKIIKNNIPNVLGVKYNIMELKNLESQNLDEAQKNRLMFAKLTVSLILLTLTRLKELYQIDQPNISFNNIKLKVKDISKLPSRFKKLIKDDIIQCNDLFNVCIQWDDEITNYLNSLVPEKFVEIPGSDYLYLEIFNEHSLLINDKPVFFQYKLLLLDNYQYLTERQRDIIDKIILEKRFNFGILIANRLEGIKRSKLITHGATQNREFIEIFLEQQWMKRKSSYRRFVTKICELRCKSSINYNKHGIGNINSYLNEETNWENKEIESYFQKKMTEFIKVAKLVHQNPIFIIEEINKITSKEEKLIKLNYELIKAHKILDNKTPKQQTLGNDFFESTDLIYQSDPSRHSEINDQLTKLKLDDSRKAAEFRTLKDMKGPIYFGWNSVVSLSNFNITQFLRICKVLYDEILEIKIKDANFRSITAERQNKIFTKLSINDWAAIKEDSNEDYVTQYFLEELAKHLNTYNDRPHAPNKGWRSGIGIKQTDGNKIVTSTKAPNSLEYYLEFAFTLSLRQNLLIPQHKDQGDPSNPTQIVYYLNKLLGVKYNIHTSYSDFLPISLKAIKQIMKRCVNKLEKELND